MAKLLLLLLLQLLCIYLLGVSGEEKCPLLLAAAGVDTTGCYVVVLKEGSSSSTFELMESKLLNLSRDGRLYGSVQSITQAITVALSASAVEKVSHPAVE